MLAFIAQGNIKEKAVYLERKIPLLASQICYILVTLLFLKIKPY
jgi:hypothetical protein